MRSNLESNLAQRLHLLAPTHQTAEATLIGSFLVPPDGPVFLFLNPGGVDRSVFLPDIPPQGGLFFIVCNTGTGTLNVLDAFGAAVANVLIGQTSLFFSSKTAWTSLLGFPPTYNDFIGGLLAEPRIVTGNFAATLADTTIAISRAAPAATAGSLPAVATRSGRPISIVDWSSAVVDHTITLTPNGAETIMRQATWPLYSNAANLASVTLWPSVSLNGWYIKP